jgi:hypothetical protein
MPAFAGMTTLLTFPCRLRVFAFYEARNSTLVTPAQAGVQR